MKEDERKKLKDEIEDDIRYLAWSDEIALEAVRLAIKYMSMIEDARKANNKKVYVITDFNDHVIGAYSTKKRAKREAKALRYVPIITTIELDKGLYDDKHITAID